jgi:hypothetical protein
MDADEVYAVSALLTSLVGVAGFLIFRLTYYNVTGILTLGVGVFLTVSFVGAAAYETNRRSASTPTDTSPTDEATDSIDIAELLSEIELRPIARNSAYSIAAFALTGLGIGLTGGLAILEFGGATGTFFGSLLLLSVVAASFIIGPVVGLAVGLGISDGAIDGFLGSLSGFIVMMSIVLLLLIAATSASLVGDVTQPPGSSDGGQFDEPSSPPPEDQSSGGGFLLQLLQTIIVFSIPTGLVGGGASALKSRSS